MQRPNGVPISVLVLTFNEETTIGRCLDSVAWSDDIVVFDSFSSDRTVEIAKAAGARVFHRQFDNEQAHRTASLSLPFKYDWVYNPDADEVTPEDLREEMTRVVSSSTRSEVAYRVRFKTFFCGKWIKRSSLYPTWVVRLFRPSRVRFSRLTNLEYHIDGTVGYLTSHFHHFTFAKGLDSWFDKHNRYSHCEALEELAHRSPAIEWRALLSSPVARRRAMKTLATRLPLRPTLRFIYMYLLHGGFLDGAPGFTYCRLLAIYEYMIVLKKRELYGHLRSDSRRPRGV